MNAQTHRKLPRRENLVPALALLLFSSFVAFSVSPVAAQTDNSPSNKPDQFNYKKEVFTREDLKVEKIPGKWMLATSVDLKQFYDSSVPVVVAAMKTSYGQGEYLGRVKVDEAKIENRSQKSIESIQLRWAIRKADEPDTVLLEGVMLPIQVQIEPFKVPLVIDIPPIYFNKIVKPLLKEGELSGHLELVVGMQGVKFADGTQWQRTQQAAFVKAAFSSPLRNFRPGFFLDLSPPWSPHPRPFTPPPCGAQPRSFASAVLFPSLQILDPPCRENMKCDYVHPAQRFATLYIMYQSAVSR
jgi:hypothetical protein